MKTLCFVNHYYGKSSNFTGQSSLKNAEGRKKTVLKCLENLQRINDIDIKVCGIKGNNLVEIDIDFSFLKDPTFLPYETLAHMSRFLEDYDYFIYVEDDILLPYQTFLNVVEFDKTAQIGEMLQPNRLETDFIGNTYCVDLLPIPRGFLNLSDDPREWTSQFKEFSGKQLRVSESKLSAILIMSRDKLRYALTKIDINFRGIVFVTAIESALYYFSSPFALYRSCLDLDFHYVLHLNRWSESPLFVPFKHPNYDSKRLDLADYAMYKILKKLRWKYIRSPLL
jgi:hypothetical protein